MLENDSPKIILASGSPRRREMLSDLGFEFTVSSADFDEEAVVLPEPEERVTALALGKALAKQAELSEARVEEPSPLIISADTLVCMKESPAGSYSYLGKPQTVEVAVQMLSKLSGKAHEVWTAYALLCGEKQLTRAVSTEISFRELSSSEIRKYAESGEPLDKAGAYGIQGGASSFVRGINGSLTSVIGLPLAEIIEDLSSYGLRPKN